MKPTIILPVILILAIAGALLQNTYILYGMIAFICLFVILVAFGKIHKKLYPYAIFTIGLSLLYQTTLMGPGLVGSDIHTEYYFYLQAMENGWDTSIPYAYNTAFGTTFLAPLLTKIFNIPGYWIYKAVFPFLFAFVTVFLYAIFKREFNAKIAFLSTYFFVIVPTWSLELIGLPRQMLAELMFAIVLFLVIASRMRLRFKVSLLIPCAVLGAMFHYTIGPIIFLYLSLGLLFLLVSRRRKFPVKWLGLATIILLVGCIGYYGLVAQGVSLRHMSSSLAAQIERIFPGISPPTSGTSPPEDSLPGMPEGEDTGMYEPLMRTALGLDFAGASPAGKTFRIFQFVTQGCLVVGCFYILKNRRRYSTEYLAFCGVAVVILAACIFLPRFSNIINVTRFYHLALFTLAPAFILGARLMFRKPQIMVLCLVIPYFLFTSGFIFEAMGHKEVSRVDIPYSIALSWERTGVAAVFSEDDTAVMRWVAESELRPIYLDINGMILFSERLNPLDWRDTWKFIPRDPKEMDGYLFLWEGNTQTETVTFKPTYLEPTGDTASGLRKSYSWKELGLDEIIGEASLIHKQGDAVLLEVR